MFSEYDEGFLALQIVQHQPLMFEDLSENNLIVSIEHLVVLT